MFIVFIYDFVTIWTPPLSSFPYQDPPQDEETKEAVRQRAAALLEDGSLSAPLYDFSE